MPTKNRCYDAFPLASKGPKSIHLNSKAGMNSPLPKSNWGICSPDSERILPEGTYHGKPWLLLSHPLSSPSPWDWNRAKRLSSHSRSLRNHQRLRLSSHVTESFSLHSGETGCQLLPSGRVELSRESWIQAARISFPGQHRPSSSPALPRKHGSLKGRSSPPGATPQRG